MVSHLLKFQPNHMNHMLVKTCDFINYDEMIRMILTNQLIYEYYQSNAGVIYYILGNETGANNGHKYYINPVLK